VVHVGNYNLAAIRFQALANGETHQANKRSSIHSERDLVTIARIQQCRHAGPRSRDDGVYLLAFAISAATLNITIQQMLENRIQDELRSLRTRGIIEKNERSGTGERGECGSYILNWECRLFNLCLGMGGHR
jgi:hypothetical protein